MNVEQWKPTVGYEDRYEVSDQGKVRRTAPGMGTTTGHVLKDWIMNAGYRAIGLYPHSGSKKKSVLIHHLVAAAFLGPRPKGLDINHKDGNKLNNSVDNLEYVTRNENMQHAYDTNLLRSTAGINNGNAKLNWPTIRLIRMIYNTGKYTIAHLARQFKVGETTINDIVHCRAWKE